LDKIIYNFGFNFKQNYNRINLLSNLFFLKKKIYLLYSFWNKKTSYFLLKKNKFSFNYNKFLSLGEKNFIKKEKNFFFDYMYIWNSSSHIYNEVILKNMFNYKNKKKRFSNIDKLIDY